MGKLHDEVSAGFKKSTRIYGEIWNAIVDRIQPRDRESTSDRETQAKLRKYL